MTASNYPTARAVALLCASLSLTACSTHIVSPQTSTMTEAEADENIAARLEKSARVHKDVTALRDMFNNIQNVMKDLGKVLNKSLDPHPGTTLIQLVDRFPEVFGSLSRALVKVEVDGSWNIEAPIVSGLSLGDLVQCRSPRARLTGKKILEQEDLVLYISDCDGNHFDRLAKWIVHPDGGIEMTTWPLVQANLRPIQGTLPETSASAPEAGSCQFGFSSVKKEVTFSCSALFTGGSTQASSRLESLSIRDVPDGTAASISLELETHAHIQAEFEPNHAPRVTFCEEGGLKCSVL